MGLHISLLNQDRLIFLGYIVLITIPFVFPVGLPIPITESTRTFHATIEAVPERGVVVWVTDHVFAYWPEIAAGEAAIYKHLFSLAQRKGIRLVFASTMAADGQVLSTNIIAQQIIPGGFTKGLKYGENWVQLGYLPGWETSLRGLVTDIHQIAPADQFGTPINQILMMKDIRSVKDISLLGGGSGFVDQYARQWTGFGKPVIVNLISGTVSLARPWVEKGLITALLNGQRGDAEYELLTGFKGASLGAMDAQSFGHIFVIVITLLCNALYYAARRRAKLDSSARAAR